MKGWALRLREALNLPRRKVAPGSLPFEVIPPSGSDRSGGDVLANPWFALDPARRSDLLVVLTTYRRAESAARVLSELRRSTTFSRLAVLVLEDTSDGYEGVRDLAHALYGEDLLWLRSTRHLGKRAHWMMYQAAFLCAEFQRSPRVLFVQDDMEFAPNAIDDANALLTALRARGSPPGRAQVLNLYSANDDEPRGRWVDFERRDMEGLPVRQTQWFDLASFLIEREALAQLRYRVIPVDENRWRKSPHLSSGVGRQLTRRLWRRASIYQCCPPLALHGGHESVMNPEARAIRPLDNRPKAP